MRARARAEVELEARGAASRSHVARRRAGWSSPSQPASSPPISTRAARPGCRNGSRAAARRVHGTRSASSSAASTRLGGEEVGPRRRALAPRRRPHARRSAARARCMRSSGSGVERCSAAVGSPARGGRGRPRRSSNSRTSSHAARAVAARATSSSEPSSVVRSVRLVLGHRVAQPHRRPRGRQPQPQRSTSSGDGEAPADRLVRARRRRARPRRGGAAAARASSTAAGAAARGQRRRELLQPPQPRDLLDQVDLAGDVVAAEGGHGDVEPVVGVGDAELEPLAGCSALLVAAGPRCRAAASTFSSRRRIVFGAGPGPADVDRAVDQPRAGQLEHQARGERLAVHRLLGREPLLEARRRPRCAAPSRVDVRWRFGPFQFAASISTRVVVSAAPRSAGRP